MRNILTAALTAGFVVLGAAAANADTATYNKYTNTHIYDGYTETNVNAHVNSQSVQKTVENSTKIESIADLGTTNIANVNVSGTIGGDIKFSADAHSSNRQPIDPVATVYVSNINQTTFTKTNEVADINTFSSNKFSGTEYTHTVGTQN